MSVSVLKIFVIVVVGVFLAICATGTNPLESIYTFVGAIIASFGAGGIVAVLCLIGILIARRSRSQA